MKAILPFALILLWSALPSSVFAESPQELNARQVDQQLQQKILNELRHLSRNTSDSDMDVILLFDALEKTIKENDILKKENELLRKKLAAAYQQMESLKLGSSSQ